MNKDKQIIIMFLIKIYCLKQSKSIKLLIFFQTINGDENDEEIIHILNNKHLISNSL